MPSRYSSRVGPVVPGRALRTVDDVVSVLGRDGDHRDVDSAQTSRGLPDLADDLVEPALVEVDQVDLVDRRDEMLDAQQFCDARVPVGLSQHAGAGVDEQDRHMRVRGAGEHVAGVALVPGGVGEDVAARLGGEEAIRHVDRDALFPFGAQAVRQCGQIGDALVVGHRFQVVERKAVGVVQQTPDQRALSVVDGSGGGDPQKLARSSEVPLALSVFHRGHRRAVVGARLTALGDGGRGDFGDDPCDVGRL